MITLSVKDTLLLAYMQHHGAKSATELREDLGPEVVTDYRLSKLVEAGLLRKVGETKAARYVFMTQDDMAVADDIDKMLSLLRDLPAGRMLGLYKSVLAQSRYAQICYDVSSRLAERGGKRDIDRRVLALVATIVEASENEQYAFYELMQQWGLVGQRLFIALQSDEVRVETEVVDSGLDYQAAQGLADWLDWLKP